MKNYNYIIPFVLFLFVLGACSEKNNIHPDPYSGGKQPLGIAFSFDTLPSPSHGSPGMEVTYKVHGLAKYDRGALKMYLHQEPIEDIKNITDSTITITVPQHASTGEVMLYVEGQVFFGPVFKVDGKVSIDPTFKAGNGTDREIKDLIEKSNSNLLMVGGFTNYDLRAANQPINRIAMTTNNGKFLSTLMSGEGANGTINSIVELPNGQLMIGGSFSKFNGHEGINSLTRLNDDGSLDTTTVSVVAMPDEPGLDTVPTFNGGVSGGVVKVFAFHNRVITVGNFQSYGRYFYETSTYETKILDETDVNQLVRMEMNGEMDSTFNYNKATDEPYPGGNGPIADAVMLDNGDLVLSGSFTHFDNIDAGGIVKIDINDGLPDATFNASGVGADGEVNTVNYNENTEKYILTGLFHQFNGLDYNGLVMLNKDGSVNESFKLKPLEGGELILLHN